MPAFTAIGAYVAGTLLGLVGTAATIVGAIVATGAAYITSRVINGNPNKGNNSSAGSQGGRIQVPPATNNKIPVLYGSAYVNGIITDARLKSLNNTTNDTMYYCIVLSEYTNNLTATPVYGIESVLWNDLRLTAVDATTNAHKVKDGRKVVNGAIVTAGSFVPASGSTPAKTYIITKLGTTTQAQWNTIAGTTGKVYDLGAIFTCADAGTGTGQAQEEDFVDTSFFTDDKYLVELRVYAGGSGSASQIYPAYSGNKVNAYEFWANNDGSWTSANEMKGLVFAIVKLTYNGDKGFTGLPNVTFQLANNVANPADVWYDYMTSKRYGAGIDPSYIDATAKAAWYDYCDEDISYTNKAGETNQVDLRYQVNGILDTNRQVKTNIDTILQNGGAWMSYNVATGLWSPIIKKAITAGIPGDATTYFTASRATNVLTVTSFPSGRIEAGQSLYNSSGTLIGTISAQLTPTAGETQGQIGRYTTSTTGSIASTTFYTTASSLLSFSDDNIISGITLSSTRLEDLYNQVEAEFYNKYNKDQKSYARTNLPSIQRNPNEPDNELRMSLDLVNSSIQADILSQLEMRQSRDDLVIDFTTNHYGIQAQAGDVINVTSDLYGWAPKLFRVMRVKEIEGEDGSLTAQIQALEYNPDVFTIEPITEFSTAANIGIGNLVSSVGLPAPTLPVITNPNPGASVPNFTFNIQVPSTGGPFDEIEIYFTEGWDPVSMTGTVAPGTGSNGAPVGDGLLTVTAITYGALNVGDYFTMSGTNFVVTQQLTNNPVSKTFVSGGAPLANTVTLNNTTGLIIGNRIKGTGLDANGALIIAIAGSQVTLDEAFSLQAAGTYTIFGGLGTYVVDVSATKSSTTTTVYDEPLDADFSFLKKIVPDGNASSFVSGGTVSVLITELPANSQTYRRYFLKSRMGWKKNFGKFSANTPFDIDGNNVNWQPNPSASGGTGVFGHINLAVIDNTTISLTNPTEYLRVLQSTTSTNVPQNGLRISVESTGTPAAGFGTNLEFEIETRPGVLKEAGLMECVLTDVTTGSEDAKLEFTLMTAGSEVPALNPQMTLENSGNLTITGDLTVSGGDLTQGTTATALRISRDTAVTNARRESLILRINSTGTPASGLGNQLTFETETAANVYTLGGYISSQITDITSGAEDFKMSFGVGSNGSSALERMFLDEAGKLTLDAGLVLNNDASSTATITANHPTKDGTITWDGTRWYINDDIEITSNGLSSINMTTALTNAPSAPLILRHTSSGTPVAGFGTTLTFETETPSSGNKVGGYIDFVMTDATTGSEDFSFGLGLMSGGVEPSFDALGRVFSVDSLGTGSFRGDVILNSDSDNTQATIYGRSSSSGTDGTIYWNGTTWSTNSPLSVTGDITTSGDIRINGNDIKSSTGATAITLSGSDVAIAGDIRINGNDIKSSSGAIAITLSGTNVQIIGDTRAGDNVILNYDQANIDAYLTAYKSTNFGSLYWDGTKWNTTHDFTIAGDLTVTGNDIKSSTGATAITLSDNDVTVTDRLYVAGNIIGSNGGYSTITMSGNDVAIAGELTVNGNEINSSTGVALQLSGTNVLVAGNLQVSGNTIKSNGSNTAITLNVSDVTVAGDLTVSGTNINTGVTNNIIQLDRTSTGTTVSARALKLQSTSTGTPAVGFGTALGFVGQTATSTFKDAGYIAVTSTDITSGSEDFSMGFGLMENGATYENKMTLNSTGNLTITGSLRTNSSEDVANASAILLDSAASYFTTGSGGETATLAIGSEGQFKSLMMEFFGGGDMVITVSNAGWKASGTGTITFNATGDSCLLQYINSKWFAVGVNGVTFA